MLEEEKMNRRQFLKAGSYLSAAYALPLTVSKQLFAANLPADLVDFTATDLSIAIRDKHTSCTEVMQSTCSIYIPITRCITP